MIIDLHFHTEQNSKCSSIDMEEGIKRASELGLDGICITDHDVFASKEEANRLQEKYNILVFVGCEIYTKEGDILCFGLDKIPDKKRIPAKELIERVNKLNGVCIAAHPYRENNRGMGKYLDYIKGIHAIETLNGNTKYINNQRALNKAKKLKLSCTGGSDAHAINKIGLYATRFFDDINNENDLIAAIRAGNIEPYTTKN